MKTPTELGYYWARLFSTSTKPCIVYVNNQDCVEEEKLVVIRKFTKVGEQE